MSEKLSEQVGGPANERYPDPTAPEIAAGELRKAEAFLRHGVRGPEAVHLADVLMDEYDRRGTELERLRQIDWSARFRAASEVAESHGYVDLAAELAEISSWGGYALGAVGRAMLGEEVRR